jgi:hypothetical protein
MKLNYATAKVVVQKYKRYRAEHLKGLPVPMIDFSSYDPNVGIVIKRRGGTRRVVRPKTLLKSFREMMSSTQLTTGR